MNAHTPGPWRYESGTKTIRSVPANYWLATLDSWDGAVRPHHEANARLMAAAPELLAALQAVWEFYEPVYVSAMADDGDRTAADEVLDAVRAAISKATGDA